jgi:23S rRNA pseudouridine2457 synthase
MTRIILVNKPYGVLSQFSGPPGTPTLKDFVAVAGVYPAGRLDADSEGLIVLTDDGRLQASISDPRHKTPKVYWAQVDGVPTAESLRKLSKGVLLRDGPTRPARVEVIAEPSNLWHRTPPVRYRKHLPTTWLCLEISEGRNRQVRRMTAAVGYPTLRLVRSRVAGWNLDGLNVGTWIDASGTTQTAPSENAGAR